MKTYTISVAGQSFQIRSDATEEHLHKLAGDITERFRKLKTGSSTGDQGFKAMSMVAVSILDELLTTRAEKESIRQSAREFAENMIATIDELLKRDL
jgi:cell division protein ZapA (FtsZ GTPase activity inhibitor)